MKIDKTEIVERYIKSLHWSDKTKDIEKTLVNANLRSFYYWLKRNGYLPDLTGKDAIRFFERMANPKPHTKKEDEEIERGMKFYAECKKKWGCPTCGHMG